MSKPFSRDEETDLLQYAAIEIISGLSSLHMDEAWVNGWKEPEDGSVVFLDEKYDYVKHSREHFRAALHAITDLQSQNKDNR